MQRGAPLTRQRRQRNGDRSGPRGDRGGVTRLGECSGPTRGCGSRAEPARSGDHLRITDVYRQAAERAAGDVHALFDAWMSLGRGLQRWQQAYADALRQSLESVADKRQALLQSDFPGALR